MPTAISRWARFSPCFYNGCLAHRRPCPCPGFVAHSVDENRAHLEIAVGTGSLRLPRPPRPKCCGAYFPLSSPVQFQFELRNEICRSHFSMPFAFPRRCRTSAPARRSPKPWRTQPAERNNANAGRVSSLVVRVLKKPMATVQTGFAGESISTLFGHTHLCPATHDGAFTLECLPVSAPVLLLMPPACMVDLSTGSPRQTLDCNPAYHNKSLQRFFSPHKPDAPDWCGGESMVADRNVS